MEINLTVVAGGGNLFTLIKQTIRGCEYGEKPYIRYDSPDGHPVPFLGTWSRLVRGLTLSSTPIDTRLESYGPQSYLVERCWFARDSFYCLHLDLAGI